MKFNFIVIVLLLLLSSKSFSESKPLGDLLPHDFLNYNFFNEINLSDIHYLSYDLLPSGVNFTQSLALFDVSRVHKVRRCNYTRSACLHSARKNILLNPNCIYEVEDKSKVLEKVYLEIQRSLRPDIEF